MGSANEHLTAQERKDRKRLQNRANQRARRQRIRLEEASKNPPKNPYRIDRWRYADVQGVPGNPIPVKPFKSIVLSCGDSGSSGSTALNDKDLPVQSQTKRACMKADGKLGAPKAECPYAAWFPLPVDQTLMHLITYNVCRGMMSNKSTLRLTANYVNTVQNPPLPLQVRATCEITVIRPTNQTIPSGLQLTQLQMNSPHPSWIDVFPFPELRDNLIRYQRHFDHIQFLEDLVGDLVHLKPPTRVQQLGNIKSRSEGQEDDDQEHHNHQGLILWGEPYLKESWEATPRFLAKWAWVTEGCGDELVGIANKWRASRGEEPIHLG